MMSNINNSGKLSLRNSILFWVSSAVCGWVLVVVFIYNTLRFPDVDPTAGKPTIVAEEPSQRLNDLAPAAGGSLDENEQDEEDGLY